MAISIGYIIIVMNNVVKQIKLLIKFIFFRKVFLPYLWFFLARSQSNNLENKNIKKYAQSLDIDRSFIEFGFHPFAYNCVGLTKLNYKGFVIDGDSQTCNKANYIFKKLGFNTKAKKHWITLSSIDIILKFVKNNGNKLGLLSVDIDGNDYWILKEIYRTVKPEIIVTEHNASFREKSISVKYEENFDRKKFHKSGWYHGASISAFYNLLKNDYFLIENINGLNLIFIRKDKLNGKFSPLLPNQAFKEPFLRNKWSGTDTLNQWEEIKNLKYNQV